MGRPTPPRTGGVRYRHRPHALAAEREYRVGTHTLRWHDAAQPGRGAGQLAHSQIAAMRLETLSGTGTTRRCRLTLRPRQGAPVVIDSDSAQGWFGRQPRPDAYRRFVRTLHAAVAQVQPQLRLEAPPPPRLAGLGPPLAALTLAVALGLARGPVWALAGFICAWPLAQWAARWQHSRRAAALPSGTLPRHLLP